MAAGQRRGRTVMESTKCRSLLPSITLLQVRDIHEAKSRIQEMECRMLQRGFPVEPINGPAFCNVNWNA